MDSVKKEGRKDYTEQHRDPHQAGKSACSHQSDEKAHDEWSTEQNTKRKVSSTRLGTCSDPAQNIQNLARLTRIKLFANDLSPPRSKLTNIYKKTKHPAPNKVKFTMSEVQLDAKHLKKHEDAACSEVINNQSEWTQNCPGWGAQLVGALSSLLA